MAGHPRITTTPTRREHHLEMDGEALDTSHLSQTSGAEIDLASIAVAIGTRPTTQRHNDTTTEARWHPPFLPTPRTFGKTVLCAVAGLANLTAQICLTCCPRRRKRASLGSSGRRRTSAMDVPARCPGDSPVEPDAPT